MKSIALNKYLIFTKQRNLFPTAEKGSSCEHGYHYHCNIWNIHTKTGKYMQIHANIQSPTAEEGGSREYGEPCGTVTLTRFTLTNTSITKTHNFPISPRRVAAVRTANLVAVDLHIT
jgi:hypothetical protein